MKRVAPCPWASMPIFRVFLKMGLSMSLFISKQQIKKIAGAVATVTMLAELAFMYVIGNMTGAANGGGMRGLATGFVTGFASQIAVFPLERVAGVLFVIKTPYVPGVGRMAGITVGAKGALVDVLHFMAVDTFLTGASKLIADMAAFTGHDPVHANERKFMEIMIELVDDIPAFGVVACAAQTHIFISMGIVSGMTACAIPSEIIVY